MSLVPPGMARNEVNTSSPRKSSRKQTCEILRHNGNREPDKDSSKRHAWAQDKPVAIIKTQGTIKQ
jgi:hypothetical protein